MRYFHHGCSRVVYAEVCKPGTVHRPPVGNICQEHLLCFTRKNNYTIRCFSWLVLRTTFYLRKSSQRGRSPRIAPGQRMWDAGVRWTRSVCSRYRRQTQRPGMSSTHRKHSQSIIKDSKVADFIAGSPIGEADGLQEWMNHWPAHTHTHAGGSQYIFTCQLISCRWALTQQQKPITLRVR